MSKTQSIRDALANGPITFRKLHEQVGGTDKQLLALCDYLRKKGEIKIGADDDKTMKLLGRKSAPPQGRRKKSAGKQQRQPVDLAPAAVSSYKDVADRFTSGKPKPAEQLRSIILENLVSSGAELRKAVKDQVENCEDNPALQSALDQHARAERLFESSCS